MQKEITVGEIMDLLRQMDKDQLKKMVNFINIYKNTGGFPLNPFE